MLVKAQVKYKIIKLNPKEPQKATVPIIGSKDFKNFVSTFSKYKSTSFLLITKEIKPAKIK